MLMRLLTTTVLASALLCPAALAQTQGGTAIVVVATELQTLNPAITSGSGEDVVGCMVEEGLVEIDGNGNPVPALAKSWTISPDGLTYTFDLVETNWQDGKPFTASDVAYSFKNVNAKYAPLFSAQLGKRIADIQVLGPHQVAIKLSQPFGPFLRILTCWNGGAIVPEHLFTGTDPLRNPVSSAPIGTGPFKFVDWTNGDSIRLAKNEHYWKAGRPYLDGVVIRFMPNAASRVQALLAGEGDYIQKYYLPVSDIATVRASRTLKLEPASQAPNVLFGFFNVMRKPFDDKAVRQALFGLIDRKFIVQAAFSGQGKPGTEPFPTGLAWAANPAINYDTMYPPNVDATNALLDKIGLKRDANGIRFKTDIDFEVGIPERLKAATAIQSAWKQVGIDVELRPLEPAVLAPRTFVEHNFGVALHSYGTYGDPALGLARAFLSSSNGVMFGNSSGYANPVVDKLFEEAASLSDTKARGDIYRKIQTILADDLPVMTLQENTGLDAASAKLNGIWGYEGAGRFGEAWFSK